MGASSVPAQSIQEAREVLGNRRLQLERAAVRGMPEAETIGVKSVTGKGHRPQRLRPEDISLLADQRVPAQPCLDANLIALPGLEPNFHECRGVKTLDDPV